MDFLVLAFKVAPALTGLNVLDIRDGNMIALGKDRAPLGTMADGKHISIREFGAGMFCTLRGNKKTIGPRMGHVLGAGNILQIIGAVVALIPVFMVNLFALWSRTKKGFGNKAVNHSCNIAIINIVDGRSEASLFLEILPKKPYRADSSIVRDLVPWATCNRPPYFLTGFSGGVIGTGKAFHASIISQPTSMHNLSL